MKARIIALLIVGAAAPPAAQDATYSLESRAAIGAHHLCSGLWVVGRVTKRTADEILAQDIAPFRDFSWDKRFTYSVDDADKTRHGPRPRHSRRAWRSSTAIRAARSCRAAKPSIHFKPVAVPRNLPDAATQPWPMGDANAAGRQPNAGVDAALDWGFEQTEHNTRAIVVVHHGKIVGERYAPGWTKDTPQISWSAGKSITAALVGIIVQRGQAEGRRCRADQGVAHEQGRSARARFACATCCA